MHKTLAVVCDHEVVLRNIDLTGVLFNDHIALRLTIKNAVNDASVFQTK